MTVIEEGSKELLAIIIASATGVLRHENRKSVLQHLTGKYRWIQFAGHDRKSAMSQVQLLYLFITIIFIIMAIELCLKALAESDVMRT